MVDIYKLFENDIKSQTFGLTDIVKMVNVVNVVKKIGDTVT